LACVSDLSGHAESIARSTFHNRIHCLEDITLSNVGDHALHVLLGYGLAVAVHGKFPKLGIQDAGLSANRICESSNRTRLNLHTEMGGAAGYPASDFVGSRKAEHLLFAQGFEFGQQGIVAAQKSVHEY
jgi:hypothetical protein